MLWKLLYTLTIIAFKALHNILAFSNVLVDISTDRFFSDDEPWTWNKNLIRQLLTPFEMFIHLRLQLYLTFTNLKLCTTNSLIMQYSKFWYYITAV